MGFPSSAGEPLGRSWRQDRRGNAALTPRVDRAERLERAASPLTQASRLSPVSAAFAHSLDVPTERDADGHGWLTMMRWTPPAPSPTLKGSAWIVAPTG